MSPKGHGAEWLNHAQAMPKTGWKRKHLTVCTWLLTTSENPSRSAHFLDSHNVLWGVSPLPINSWSMSNETTANETLQTWKSCGSEVEGHPLSQQSSDYGGDREDENWGNGEEEVWAEEGETDTHRWTDWAWRQEGHSRRGTCGQGRWHLLGVSWRSVAPWWRILSQTRSPVGCTWTALCVLVRTTVIKDHRRGGL